MKKITPFAVVLSALFALGCGAEMAPEEISISDDVEAPGSGVLVEDVESVCPLRVDMIDELVETNPTDIEYDAEGRVVSSSYDTDADGVADTRCDYGYGDRGLLVVTADFDADGEADGWIYPESERGDLGAPSYY